MSRSLPWVVVTSFALLFTGSASGDDADAVWHARPWPPLARPRGGNDISQKEYVQVELPEAPLAWRFPIHTDRPVFVLNLLADGKLQFKGNTYDLEGDRPEWALQDLRQYIEALVGGPVDALVHADRAASSAHVLAVLAIVSEIPDVREVRIAVRDWRTRRDGALRFRALHTSDSIPSVEWRLGAVDRAVRLAVWDRSWDLPLGADLDDPSFLRQANRVWAEVWRVVREGPGDEHPVLVLDSRGAEIPFAYFATVLEMVARGATARVSVPDARLEMEYLLPPAILERDERAEGSGPDAILVAACALALLLAAATAIPLRGRAGRSRSGGKAGSGGHPPRQAKV